MGALGADDDPAVLVRQGHSELVFTHLPVAAQGLTVRELGVLEYVLVAPPETLTDDADSVAIKDLPDLPMLLVPRAAPMRVQIERELQVAGKLTRAAVVTHHLESLAPMVLEGVGATFMERTAALRLRRRGAEVRALDPPVYRSHGVVFDARRLSSVGQAFLEHAARWQAENEHTD